MNFSNDPGVAHPLDGVEYELDKQRTDEDEVVYSAYAEVKGRYLEVEFEEPNVEPSEEEILVRLGEALDTLLAYEEDL